LHYILGKCNKTLDEQVAKALFNESIENVLSLDVGDESYRIWERDYRDTIETVNRFIYNHRLVLHSLRDIIGL
jgi:hypothetical protein